MVRSIATFVHVAEEDKATVPNCDKIKAENDGKEDDPVVHADVTRMFVRWSRAMS